MTDYFQQLLALQPPGKALPDDADSVWGRLLDALARMFQAAEDRSDDLTRESDPRACVETIGDWERVCGLPGLCAPPDRLLTLQFRRAAVVNVLNRMGGQTPEYFRRLAKIAGVSITITEYRPFIAGLSRCGQSLDGPEDVRFVWRVTAEGQRVTRFRCGSAGCGERLSDFDPAEELECLLRQDAPAHTVLIVGYR